MAIRDDTVLQFIFEHYEEEIDKYFFNDEEGTNS